VLEQRRREYDGLARELGVEIVDGTRPMEDIALSIRRTLADAVAVPKPQHSR